MKADVIIAASGASVRAGSDKLRFDLGGIPLLARTVSAFSTVPRVENIIVVARADSEEFVSSLATYAGEKGYKTVTGAATRSESVLNGLKAASSEAVLVHDGARPYPTAALINTVIDSVERYSSGVPALPLNDSVRIAHRGALTGEFPRDSLLSVQTPQGYLREELLKAYAATPGKEFTDESARYAVIHPEGARVVPGEERNIKVTSYGDFAALNAKIGIGYDIHRLVPFGKLMLCGVEIASETGTLAHSDGDAAIHALIDALLSAAGEADIGTWFPDTDPRYDGIDSSILLTKTMAILAAKNLRPVSVSIIIRLERPKLKEYIPVMKVKLSSILGISADNIGVSAKTGEGLDSVGKGLAVAAEAAVLIN